MGQDFQIVRCFSCETFQVQQVKKVNRWSCKVCGLKQSLIKEFGRGSGADCRRHVQKLNAARGAKMEAQDAARGAKMEAQDTARGAKMEAQDAARGAKMEAQDTARGAKMEAQDTARGAKMEAQDTARGAKMEAQDAAAGAQCFWKLFDEEEQLQLKPVSRWNKYLSAPLKEVGLEQEEAESEEVVMDREQLSLRKHRPKSHQDHNKRRKTQDQDRSRPHSSSGTFSKWSEFLKSPDSSGPRSGLCGSSLFQTGEDFSVDLDRV